MSGDDAGVETDVRVPISALEHFSYCARQCALIHVEQTFDENVFTVRGRLAHARVDSGLISAPRGVRQVRSLPLWVRRIWPDWQGRRRRVSQRWASSCRIQGRSNHRRPRRAAALRPSALSGRDARRAGPVRSALLTRYKAARFRRNRRRTSGTYASGPWPR